MTERPLRLAVAGGHRGRMVRNICRYFPEKARLAAICDVNEDVLREWKALDPEVAVFSSYESLLEWGEFDAVYIATPLPLHASQSIQALEAGKHVLSEVTAARTLDECWALVEAVEKTGLVYMMAENYCYKRPNMMVLNMVRQGLFGELVYAEGAYIHDTRDLAIKPDGTLTWRGEARRHNWGNSYPTHSLGPVAQWLGVNRPGGDRLATTATFVSGAFSMRPWVIERFGPGHPGAAPGYFPKGDSAITVIQTEKGALIVLRVDTSSPRPHNMSHYVLQGTKASYVSARHGGEDPLIWIDGRSPGYSPPRDGKHAEWESLWKYAPEYEHPRWREKGGTASGAGHGGGDYFVVEDFVDCVLEGNRPPIDVYDAVTWSCITPLSRMSLERGGAPVEIPRFDARRSGSAG